MKKEIKNVVDIQPESDLHSIVKEEYMGVKYLLKDLSDSVKLVKFMMDFIKEANVKGVTTEEEYVKVLESKLDREIVEELLYEFSLDWFDEEDEEGFETFSDIVENGMFYELMEYLEYNAFRNERLEFFNLVAECANFNFGKVGYSDWSYYISYHNVKESFVRDLWEGYNWYSLVLLDTNGDIVDSIGGIYAPTKDDLVEAVEAHFGVTEFHVLDSEDSKYIDLPKAKKIVEKVAFEEI